MGYDSILRGISEECRKQRITPRFLSLSIEEIPSVQNTNEIILMQGYTEAWTTALFLHLAALNNTVILLGNTLPIQDNRLNTVSIDHRQVMLQSISYLQAAERKLSIPDDLYVMSFGGTRISQFCTPALTTVSLSYYQCGCTAVSMIPLLHGSGKEPVHITLQSDLCPRASTADIPFTAVSDIPVSYNENVEEITQDQNFLNIGKLERLFACCDDVDMQILCKLWANETYEQISEEIPMAVTTIHYRLGKLLQHAQISGKKELFRLLDYYRLRL